MKKEPKFKVGDKIYFIAYEEDHASYTIVGMDEVNYDDPYMQSGIWYSIHSDLLSIETGYHPIYENVIDTDDRFFSSPELAHKAYEKWKEKKKKDSVISMAISINVKK